MSSIRIDSDKGLIWYEYKGDEIAWNGEVYLSRLLYASFSSLKEMDEFWAILVNKIIESVGE